MHFINSITYLHRKYDYSIKMPLSIGSIVYFIDRFKW